MLVENYRPTVMERAGLGYDVLRAQNPRLIYAQLSGYGYDGPYRDKGGFDLIAQGMGGIMTRERRAGRAADVRRAARSAISAPACGPCRASSPRSTSASAPAQGQRVECSLLETAIGFSSWTSAGWLADRQEPTRQGSRHRQNAPYQRFATGDGFIMIGAAGQHIWERCARALGRPEWLEDPRFRTGRDRMRNRPALEREMEALLVTQPSEHWVKVLDDAGVPCGPVYTYAQLFADPQVVHRELVVHADDPELGHVPHIRTPIKMSAGAVAVRAVAPKLGQHTAEVLGALGYSESDLARLRRDHVV